MDNNGIYMNPSQAEYPAPNKTRRIPKFVWIVGLGVVLVAIIVIVATGGKNGNVTAAGSAADVAINSSGLSASTLKVPVGTTVTWTNDDTSGHWIASDPYPLDNIHSDFNSLGSLHTGDSYSYTFTSPGTYNYHDQLNPYKIMGTVQVN